MTPLKPICAALPAIALAAGLITMSAPGTAQAQDHMQNHATMPEHGTMHVTKSPACGCCGAWVALARHEGFDVETTDTGDVTQIKQEANVPGQLWSCHTARIDGYVIEGHVPFDAIAKLLDLRPDIVGIAVPGMPAGSPGMGDDPNARFDVIAFGGDAGAGEVFHRAGR